MTEDQDPAYWPDRFELILCLVLAFCSGFIATVAFAGSV